MLGASSACNDRVLRLAGKVALLSGAARGQGATEARLFVAEGAQVVLGDVRDDEGRRLEDELGDAAAYVHHDVTDPGGWRTIVDTALDRFGRVDVLVNNAGIFAARPFTELRLEEYRQVIEVNQVGTFLGMQTVAPTMIAQNSGSIVNISSTAGLHGSSGTIAYTASKWAVRGMTKVAARELAPHGVRVNSVHPGAIDTAMLAGFQGAVRDQLVQGIPMGRMAEAEEVARLVLWLASDESSYSTGSEFVIDGGMTA
jgi:3alpha(or 20beta)-hydroxysteroid dehydrogenase